VFDGRRTATTAFLWSHGGRWGERETTALDECVELQAGNGASHGGAGAGLLCGCVVHRPDLGDIHQGRAREEEAQAPMRSGGRSVADMAALLHGAARSGDSSCGVGID
jgi:hypothetical protein